MTNLQIVAFCAACLTLVSGIAAVTYPHAAMSADQRARLDTPQPPDSLEAVNLGPIFGKVPVRTLLEGHLAKMERDAAQGVAPAKLPDFGGC